LRYKIFFMTQISGNPFEALESRLIIIEEKLEDLKRISKDSSVSSESIIDIGDITIAEQYTGLAKPTIYALVSQHKIPFMKQGKRLYFSKQELVDWIKSGRKKTLLEKDSAVHVLKTRKNGKI
jgi:excisionase family DNA binding protein